MNVITGNYVSHVNIRAYERVMKKIITLQKIQILILALKEHPLPSWMRR